MPANLAKPVPNARGLGLVDQLIVRYWHICLRDDQRMGYQQCGAISKARMLEPLRRA